jgi:hypothetical protein
MNADAHLPLILRQHGDRVGILDADHLAGPGPGEGWVEERGDERRWLFGLVALGMLTSLNSPAP